MTTPRAACGPTVDIVRTEGVRVARCPCGTLHVTLHKSGVTMQLSSEYFGEVAQALSLARTILTEPEQSVAPQDEPEASGGFVTMIPAAFKKSPNSN